MIVHKLIVYEMTSEKNECYKMAVDKMTVSKMTSQMTVDKFSCYKMTLDEHYRL